MNDILKCIYGRRSVRKYLDKAVDTDVLIELANAGGCAPTGRNVQATEFTVVTNPQILHRFNLAVKQLALESGSEFARIRAERQDYCFYFSAPALIIVSNSPAALFPREDTGCALQNILLAAFSLGLGSCWVNQLSYPYCDEPRIRSLLTEVGVPTENKVYGSAAIGYPDEKPQSARSEKLKISIFGGNE